MDLLRLRNKIQALGLKSARDSARAVEEGRELDAAFAEGELHRTIEVLALIDEALSR
jgi:hypothetical protein